MSVEILICKYGFKCVFKIVAPLYLTDIREMYAFYEISINVNLSESESKSVLLNKCLTYIIRRFIKHPDRNT